MLLAHRADYLKKAVTEHTTPLREATLECEKMCQNEEWKLNATVALVRPTITGVVVQA